MKTTASATLQLALLCLCPAVVAFLSAPMPLRISTSSDITTSSSSMCIKMASSDDTPAQAVSRGNFLKSATLALGGGLLATAATCGSSQQRSALALPPSQAPDLSPILLTYEGKPRRFGDIMGKSGTLVVNVASYCALTPQYPALEKLYETFHDQGLEVIGVGCNQFGGQEPERMEKVRKDMKERYGVQFPLYDKIEVNGAGRHPLYTALFQYEPELSGYATRVSWNFEKFLLDKNGVPVRRFRPGVVPEEMAADVEMLLKTGRVNPARKKSLNEY